MSRELRVGILMGGSSSERDVSLKSGNAVSRALRSLRYDVVDIDAQTDVGQVLTRQRVDMAFVALHGGVGENGAMQGLLEVMGIPYTGSGVLASALAMDKLASKIVFEAHGVQVPSYEAVSELGQQVAHETKYPLVVKPSREGSSVGVNIVRKEADLTKALAAALEFDGPAVLEEYVVGREVQIGILGDRVLGGVEVRPKVEFYSYEAKYTAGLTEYVLPPDLEPELYQEAQAVGLRAHRALGCSGATRVDLLVTEEGAIYALEVNTIPGMTETSLLPKIAARAGLEFPALIEEIINDALVRARGRA
jgi:D-alanine-D-alanine ligase